MKVIFNADDFGRSRDINAAVIRAHREGVLTSASLMVTGEAAEEAVALAKSHPTLAVGLHVVLVNGRSTLPPDQIPHLVDSGGRFPDDAAQLGLRYFLSGMAQKELTREMTAQFDRFAATGLSLSHVDSHTHIHVVPSVMARLIPLASQYGARGFRLPRDDLRLALDYDRRRAATKTAWAFIFGLLCRIPLNRIRDHRLTVTHRVYGLFQSGEMRQEYVIRLLRRLNVPTAELYFHPSIRPTGEPLGPNPDDLATLLSPAVKQVLEERGLRLSTYPALQEEER